MNPTIASGRRDRQNDIRLRSMDASASCSSAVDEQAAFAYNVLAFAEAFQDLDHLSIGQAGLDFAALDRLVVTCDPDMGRFPIVDDRVTRDSQRTVSFSR